MAFTTVFAPYCTADGSVLLILPLVNSFHEGLSAVLLSGLQCIAHTSARQRLSQRFARRIALRMAAHCSLFRSSTVFTTVFAPYCPADGSVLLILPLVNSFHDGLAQCCPADGIGLLILALVNGFHDGSRAVFLSGWRRISHAFSHQRLSQRFARRIAVQIAAHCSYFRSSPAFTTVSTPYCSADDSGLLILPLVKAFHDELRAVLLSGRQRIARTSIRQRLSRRIACRIALWIAVHF